MVCKNCNCNNKENSKFCSNCGMPLEGQITYKKDTIKYVIIFTLIFLLAFFLFFIIYLVFKPNIITFEILLFIFIILFSIAVRIYVKNKSYGGNVKTYNLPIKSNFIDDKLLYDKLLEKLTIMEYYQIGGYSKPTFIKKGEFIQGNVDNYISVYIQNGLIYLEAWCMQGKKIFPPHQGAYAWDQKSIFMKELEEIKNYFQF